MKKMPSYFWKPIDKLHRSWTQKTPTGEIQNSVGDDANNALVKWLSFFRSIIQTESTKKLAAKFSQEKIKPLGKNNLLKQTA